MPNPMSLPRLAPRPGARTWGTDELGRSCENPQPVVKKRDDKAGAATAIFWGSRRGFLRFSRPFGTGKDLREPCPGISCRATNKRPFGTLETEAENSGTAKIPSLSSKAGEKAGATGDFLKRMDGPAPGALGHRRS